MSRHDPGSADGAVRCTTARTLLTVPAGSGWPALLPVRDTVGGDSLN